MNEGEQPSRIGALDGLRGVAILLVLGFHLFGSPLSNVYPNSYFVRVLDLGWCGVDLFFVLSGFLIGGILLDHRDSTRYYGTFYLRRACRILPPYLLAIVILEPLARFTGSGRTPWYTYAFTANFAYVFGTIWVGMWHLWSLAAEEQFYLILPPFLRWRPKAILVVAAVVVLASPLVRYFEWHAFGYLGARFLPPGHSDGLLAGVVIAYGVRRAPTLFQRIEPVLRPLILGLAGVMLLFAGFGWTNRELPVAVAGYSICTILFGITVASTVVSPRKWRWLSDPQLRLIGRYSYTIYLVHYPLYWLFAGVSYPLAVCVSVIVSFAIAPLSWHILESRMISFGHTFGYSEIDSIDRAPVVPEFASRSAE